jgi:hypothetical protein
MYIYIWYSYSYYAGTCEVGEEEAVADVCSEEVEVCEEGVGRLSMRQVSGQSRYRSSPTIISTTIRQHASAYAGKREHT